MADPWHDYRPYCHDRLRIDRARHAASDRAPFHFDKSRFTVIDPVDTDRHLLDERGIAFIQKAVTRENFVDLLKPLLTNGPGQPFIVNLSVEVSSAAIMRLAHEVGALYIDTVAEPWPGFYDDPRLTQSQRSNYALRQEVLDQRAALGAGPTAISCCGANPGMVSWFVKQALLNVAEDLGITAPEPTTREEWARLAKGVGVKGIHIAERDTQRAKTPKPMGVFVNTWSVEGFVSEGLQPAELGWGTHEKHLPPEGRRHEYGPDCAIYLLRPGAGTRVRSWTPTPGPQHGFLVTHNESISIADYLTLRENGEVIYRPTVHYAYRPADDAVLSLDEMAGAQWKQQDDWHILGENEIVDGIDELGVLLYGHAKNAYWYGSQLVDRGNAAHRALSECDRTASQLRRARRHGLGAGKSAAPASSRPTKWISAAASKCNCPISSR